MYTYKVLSIGDKVRFTRDWRDWKEGQIAEVKKVTVDMRTGFPDFWYILEDGNYHDIRCFDMQFIEYLPKD